MPINAGYEYLNAEKAYLEAQTLDEKIHCLEEMIRTAPKHKGSENLLAGLKTRLKKFLEKKEKGRSVGKSSRKTIKKEGYQCALIGLPNAGKSALLASLTNAQPYISALPFTTQEPEIGTLDYQGVKAQIVDLPAVNGEAFDIGLVNTADCLLLVIEKLEDLPQLEQYLTRAHGTRLIIITKIDLLSEEQRRKLEMTVKSKRLNAILVSITKNENINKVKEQIVKGMYIIRVYTKEPGKPPATLPVVLPEGATVYNVAESILKGFSTKVKESRLTGPSSKFPNQRVGLSHMLKDKDIIEFHTK